MYTDTPVIGLLHAVEQSVAPAQAAFDGFKDIVRVKNLVAPTMVGAVDSCGRAGRDTMRRFARCAFDFSEAGIDMLVVVCGICSQFVPDIESFLDIPVIAADMPMIRLAVNIGGRIGVAATKPGCAGLCAEKLKGVKPTLNIAQATRQTALDACRELDCSCDLILLSQLSMTLTPKQQENLHARILRPAYVLAEYAANSFRKE